MIEFQDVSVYYEEKNGKLFAALSSFSAQFLEGETTVILGESGSGKTTLLKALIDGVLYNGEIMINGVPLRKMPLGKRDISYVSQEFDLYPKMTVFENISFPLLIQKLSKDEIRRRTYEMISFLDLVPYLSRQPRYLSVGQRQKVALGKALIRDSGIYLFDEPFSNLDKRAAEELLSYLKAWFEEKKKTVLFVTHSEKEALYIAKKIMILEKGKTIFVGTPSEALSSLSRAVRAYFPDESVIKGDGGRL